MDCSTRRFTNFSAAWATIGADPKNGWIVNLGATLGRAGCRSRASNHDESWQLFFGHPELNLRIVAFEGSESAIKETEAEFRRKGGRYELRPGIRERAELIQMYVSPKTIVEELKQRGVPHGFALLKIDIDSVDLEVFAAITQRFAPDLVFVERTDYSNGFPFAALSSGLGESPARYNLGMTGANQFRRFGCLGASTSMWRTFHEHFKPPRSAAGQPDRGHPRGVAGGRPHPLGHMGGYEVVLAAGKNLLLVKSAHAGKFAGPSDPACFQEPKPNPKPFEKLRHIDFWCNEVNTSYYIEHEGVCCPTVAEGQALNLTRCRCGLITDETSFARGRWPLAPRQRLD